MSNELIDNDGTPLDNEDIETCARCKRPFPCELIQPLFTNDGRERMCPICALQLVNAIHGFPQDTPFHGSMAQYTYEQAIEFVEANGLPHPINILDGGAS